MRKVLLGALAATAVTGSLLALNAFGAPGDAPPGPADAQRMIEDHEALLDADLAGLKAALKLTPDQEKNWGPFEDAVRNAAKARQDAMREMREEMRAKTMASPIDRLDMVATRLEDAAKQMHTIAAAARPLFASLDAAQQQRFVFLARVMMEHGRGGMPHPMMMGMGGAPWGPPPAEAPTPNAQ